ncbi:MAG: glycoside hydrolase family 28 protein [Mangrovibacterium sp.]
MWHTAPITLRSGVDLHISEGATLLFTTDTKLFPIVFTRWEGVECYNYQPLIYARGESHIAITGKGIIDGGAANENWWRMTGSPRFGGSEATYTQLIGRTQLMEWNEKGTPVEQRVLGEGYGLRPQMINLVECRNILIEDVTLLRSPFWVIHPLLCNNLTVRRVSIENEGPNGDGCDPESCRNVLIEDCYFNTGDDCIAIKAGRNGDGRNWNVPSENIIIRNCEMKNGHGGVVIGSEISGGYKTLFVEDCAMDSPLLERVIRIKTNTCRGGVIEDIFVRNVKVGQCNEAVLKIDLMYDHKEDCDHAYPPTVRNINLENVTCRESTYGVMIIALESHTNVYGITISDCRFDGVAKGNFISGLTDDIHYNNYYLNGELVKQMGIKRPVGLDK